MSEIRPREHPTTEIANVLFIDIVGFSRLGMESQTEAISQLREIVRSTEEFKKTSGFGELVRIDTGDGMALVFLRDPISPLRCAIETGDLLRDTGLRVRMGIHSGPVSRNTDINGVVNVVGAGINTAQRVMDAGDAGHILLSQSAADILSQFESWADHVHDLGEVEVKHGQVLHLFNFCDSEHGNPDRPRAAIRRAKNQAAASTQLVVAILYKRGAAPEERLLRLLEPAIREAGFHVFVDRHMAIGVDWAMEIQRQISGAYAVIPLLSQASVSSEMLDFEISAANRAAQDHDGIPHILPVRVAYEGALPDSIGAVLSHLQYFPWNSPADDKALIQSIIRTLANTNEPMTEPLKLEAVGGAVPLQSKFYIERPTDIEFLNSIRRQDSIVLIKGARQMGKTSLLARGLNLARQGGSKVALTDLQSLNTKQLAGLDAFYMTLSELLAEQLDIDIDPLENWNPARGPNLNFERFIKREVMGRVDGHLVWGLDEVDRLFTCNFGSEVFGLFRSWHNRRSLDPSGPWSRLSLVIAYATEAHLFISDLNQSPFNVGTRITLSDFTPKQVDELNFRYGSPLRSTEEEEKFYRLLSGQPYLVRRGLDAMVSRPMTWDEFEKQADRDDGLFGDHLRRLLMLLAQDHPLTDAVRDLLNGRSLVNTEVFYRMRSGGLVSGESSGEANLRCKLYENYLRRHLLG